MGSGTLLIVSFVVLLASFSTIFIFEDGMNQLEVCDDTGRLCELGEIVSLDPLQFQWRRAGMLTARYVRGRIDKVFSIIATNIAKKLHPRVDHELTIEGIDGPIEVRLDSRGIPHIKAMSLDDSAFGVGYSYGVLRLFQMEINRLISRGMLSEVFGERVVKMDKFSRVLGFHELTKRGHTYSYDTLIEDEIIDPKEAELERIHKESLVRGINTYINGPNFKMPMELRTLGYSEVRNFTINEIDAWVRFNEFQMSKGWSREITLSLMENSFGEDLSEDMAFTYSDFFPTHTQILNEANKENSNPSEKKKKLYEEKELPDVTSFKGTEDKDLELDFDSSIGGSNCFAVSGEHTDTGNAYLAYDPHLPSVCPSYWIQYSVLIERDGEEPLSFVGGGPVMNAAGTIFKTKYTSLGVTLANLDVSDTYIVRFKKEAEPNGDRLYEHDGEFKTAVRRREIIKTKEGKEIPMDVLFTPEYGVVISDALGLNITDKGVVPFYQEQDYDYKLCLKSSSLTQLKPNELGTSTQFTMNNIHAKNVQDISKLLDRLKGPPLNAVFADSNGQIGNQMIGKIPMRVNPGDGVKPSRSWLGENKWIKLESGKVTPRKFNPEHGFLVSSNHKHNVEDIHYPIKNTVAPGWRAERIQQAIEKAIQSGKVTLNDMANIQTDYITNSGLEYQKIFLSFPSLESKFCSSQETLEQRVLCDAYQNFKNWDGSTDVESSGASIYQVTMLTTMVKLYENALQNREMVDLALGKGYVPVINPATELVYQSQCHMLAVISSDPKSTYDSPYQVNIPQVSGKWLEKTGGAEKLLEDSFTYSIRWLAKRFRDIDQTDTVDVSSWRWGSIHHVTFEHSFGIMSPYLRRLLSPTAEVNGDGETPSMSSMAPFKKKLDQTGWGVSLRMISNMSNDKVSDTRLSIPAGNSGLFGEYGYFSEVETLSKGFLPKLVPESLSEEETVRLFRFDKKESE